MGACVLWSGLAIGSRAGQRQGTDVFVGSLETERLGTQAAKPLEEQILPPDPAPASASVVNDLADDAAPIRPFIEGGFRGPIPGSDPSVDSIDYGGDLAQALGILSAARARGLQYGEALAYQFADGRLAVAVPLVGTLI
jgi:hypothetical protein